MLLRGFFKLLYIRVSVCVRSLGGESALRTYSPKLLSLAYSRFPHTARRQLLVIPRSPPGRWRKLDGAREPARPCTHLRLAKKILHLHRELAHSVLLYLESLYTTLVTHPLWRINDSALSDLHSHVKIPNAYLLLCVRSLQYCTPMAKGFSIVFDRSDADSPHLTNFTTEGLDIMSFEEQKAAKPTNWKFLTLCKYAWNTWEYSL